MLRRPLRKWDHRAAASADRYVVNSNAVRKRVADLYGIEAAVIHPPAILGPDGVSSPPAGIEPGFFLCVSRLLGYKNVQAVVAAFADLPHERLVVVGTGPLAKRLEAAATGNVTLTGPVEDGSLRWLYQSCQGLVAASYEDFGLTPVEAAAFAKPTAVLRWGGFLDTTIEGETGVFFDRPEPALIGRAVRQVAASAWDPDRLRAHAERFSAREFASKLRGIVEEESALA
jgi:glycosyltransferase involved in cell wall biosynthesis